MEVNGDNSEWVKQSAPGIRPLGLLALGCAALSIVLAPTYFFTPLAYLPAALALFLGFAARSESSTRKTGTIAVVLAVLAILVATAVITFTF